MAEKLIRDLDPKRAAARGVNLDTRRAAFDEMPALLRAKLYEEVGEYLEDPCDEELADVAEVVVALSRHYPHAGPDAVQRVQQAKYHDRGGFYDGVVLKLPDVVAPPSPPETPAPALSHSSPTAAPTLDRKRLERLVNTYGRAADKYGVSDLQTGLSRAALISAVMDAIAAPETPAPGGMSPTALATIERAVERSTGIDVETLRRTPLDEIPSLRAASPASAPLSGSPSPATGDET